MSPWKTDELLEFGASAELEKRYAPKLLVVLFLRRSHPVFIECSRNQSLPKFIANPSTSSFEECRPRIGQDAVFIQVYQVCGQDL